MAFTTSCSEFHPALEPLSFAFPIKLGKGFLISREVEAESSKKTGSFLTLNLHQPVNIFAKFRLSRLLP